MKTYSFLILDDIIICQSCHCTLFLDDDMQDFFIENILILNLESNDNHRFNLVSRLTCIKYLGVQKICYLLLFHRCICFLRLDLFQMQKSKAGGEHILKYFSKIHPCFHTDFASNLLSFLTFAPTLAFVVSFRPVCFGPGFPLLSNQK